MMPVDYRKRMKKALDLIPGGAMLVMSMPESVRNSDVHHHYRQDSLMHYLCGCEEPETALLLVARSSESPRVIVFVRRRNAEAELWEGKRLGVDAAVEALNVDAAYPIEELWTQLPQLVKGVERFYYEFGKNPKWDEAFINARREEKRQRGRNTSASKFPIYDLEWLAGRLRLIKGAEEVQRMHRAAAISQSAYEKVFRTVKPGMNEREVHGILVGEFMRNGAEMEAYPSIVAGGVNACCLHYRTNNAELIDGQMLLIDAGAQFDYYASDVTRTFPIGKKFSVEQRAIYELVLETQLLGIGLCRPGNTLQMIHDATCKRITEGLVDLGFLKGSVDELLEQKTYRKYYPHGTGHWLGMDVHDAGDYVDESHHHLSLQAGMCFTVEPGIYIDPADVSVPPGFRGIGVRIEDDIHITNDGSEVLTSGIPKQVHELEDRL